MQRTIGNQALAGLLAGGRIQPRLTATSPIDSDQESDPNPRPAFCFPRPPVIQRKCACGGSCAKCAAEKEKTRAPRLQLSPVSSRLQRAAKDAVAQPEAKAVPESDRGPTLGLIVEDEASLGSPRQIKKSAFFALLEADICATADAELAAVGRSSNSCPYISKWMAFYREQSAAHIERALLKYAPEATDANTARDYIVVVRHRVRRAVALWAKTGCVTGVPPGVGLMPSGREGGESTKEGGEGKKKDEGFGMGLLRAFSGAGRAQFKERDGASKQPTDAESVRDQLGHGRTLDSRTRSRMESAFGSDFSSVRVHDDSSAWGLSSQLNARAFTVGNNVAFGAGEYQPGSLVGDALIAHELAHVVQQGAASQSNAPLLKGDGDYDALEADADLSAVGAVASLWAGAKGKLAEIARNASPRLKSGLKLQRCGSDTQQPEGTKAITPADASSAPASSRLPAVDQPPPPQTTKTPTETPKPKPQPLDTALRPFRDEVQRARIELRHAIDKPESDFLIAALKRTVELMEFESSNNTALPLMYPGPSGPMDWHIAVRRQAASSLLPPLLDDTTLERIRAKENEYIDLYVTLRNYKARSLHAILIPKKGISYLISENDETQEALNEIADQLKSWFAKHRADPDVLTHDAKWGLGEMLADRRDLIVMLRLAQGKPVESEKFYDGINRPAFVIVTEVAISFIPIVGNAVALYEAYSGEDLFGYELDTVDRAILAASVLLPFVGRFIKGGRALYTAERMAQLYGRDAAQWSRVISAGERLSASPQGRKLLSESANLVRSGKHVAEDVSRAKQLEQLLKDIGLTERTGTSVAKAAAGDATRAQAGADLLKSLYDRFPLLKQLELDLPAVDRVFAKGPSVQHMKGQLLEELLEARVQRMLGTAEGKVILGAEKASGKIEFIPGHFIRDSAGRQWSDGILAIRRGGRLEVLTVFEAKAGRRAARELTLAGGSISDLSKAEREELRAYAEDILRDLQEQAQGTGKSVTKTVEDIEKEIILSEKGGQIRRDIERVASDDKPSTLFISGQETQVVVRPSTTKFVGVLPKDVSEKTLLKEAKEQGLQLDILKFDVKSADLESIAKELLKVPSPPK